MTDTEELELLELLEQEDRERVAPKFDLWRKPAPYKVACSGRGGGAKSMSVASLLVQNMEEGKISKWLCAREIQCSLEESSFALIEETITRLRYKRWRMVPSSSKIINEKTGGYFKFLGLKDIRAVKSKKSLQGYDGCWVEECEDILEEFWDILLPIFRKETAEVWATFNRNREMDAVYKMFFVNPPDGTIAMELLPGKRDNPWFPEILQRQLEHDYKTKPDIAEHKWGGKPREQGFNAVMNRVEVRRAMNRKIQHPVGEKVCGVDVARFGDDASTMYLRHGLKIVKTDKIYKSDLMTLSSKVWDFIDRNPQTRINIDDTGVGGGCTDRLKHLGAKVNPINFGARALDKNKYRNRVTEIWFEFPIEEVDIPDDDNLMDELTERLYDYDKAEIKELESKKEFKKRYGKSPDDADGLLLCFAKTHNIGMTDGARAALTARKNR